ncbi:prepilin peptidase [Burkholderia multivorans]|uniref:Prepilin peptidase n=1 Tax=Burkholderia multivorans TaxID=87883 RepID=A0AAP2HNE6_9BURK|nr:prepilin peptidase [Burkholderia multivorans]MBU9359480.1 prepilin peptidase [Burkholderia multivorans]MBU9595219.1 prepilin peptidase [Burkholderia multivorans]MCA8456520.1 prepilin peptidase [Burkholderia multivorans]MCA8484493.1 prepilin peptidase [Burkholderia multivorans]MDN7869695.1 prepilin peptidase [Burkholderia multivorans]
MAQLIFIGAFLAWAAFVAASDVRVRRVPNSLVLGGLALAFLSAFLNANPFGISPLSATIGMLIGLIALVPFFLLRVMGAADLKVFAVLGAWCGVHALLWLWIVASLAAGIHALVLMLVSRTPIRALWPQGQPVLMLGGHRATPYAACLVAPAAVWGVYLAVAGGGR